MSILPVVGNVPMNQLAQMIMKPSSETQGQYKLISSSLNGGAMNTPLNSSDIITMRRWYAVDHSKLQS